MGMIRIESSRFDLWNMEAYFIGQKATQAQHDQTAFDARRMNAMKVLGQGPSGTPGGTEAFNCQIPSAFVRVKRVVRISRRRLP
jgi:hypothetical protein